jgi:hypothetical protein
VQTTAAALAPRSNLKEIPTSSAPSYLVASKDGPSHGGVTSVATRYPKTATASRD